MALVTTGFAAAPSESAEAMMTIAVTYSGNANHSPCKCGACKLRKAAIGGLRTPENISNHPYEVQEHEAGEQHRERSDAALPLVVVRPVRPGLIGRAVVRRIATAREPADAEEHGEQDSGQGEQTLP
jgi:hypothetical protein